MSGRFDRPEPLVEPLTHREREILLRLSSDLYNREIAEALSLAPSSIKWYTRQIYAKLGVNSRKAAIQRARELGLLETKTGPVLYPHNLPATLTPFVGRQAELEQVRQLLADPAYRLLTLTGAGGVGKTRLALRAADELQANYLQGAWWVELASLSDPALVPQTVAAAFDLRPDRDRPFLNGIVDFLRSRNLLLVLDNCEHLVSACASLVNSLLLGCPSLHILATSREALGIEAERTYRVPSLSFPEPGEKISPEDLTKYAAVDLFTRRASVALPEFELDEANAAAVTGICRHLDGIPLALELAAARLHVMDVDEIASLLEDRFRLLVGGDRAALPRMQTMHASIDWSYQLLTQAEKTLLRRLSVFAGGWSLAAARAVCSDDTFLEADIPDLLGRLVDKSLVQVLRRKGQELRYRLLETLRQYTQEKLLDAGEQTPTRDRHLSYFVFLAEQAAPGLEGPNSITWLVRLDDELDNLRLALECSLVKDVEAGLRLITPIGKFWEERGRMREHYDWITRLLERPEAQAHPLAHARALGMKASDLFYLGDLDQARSCAEMSLDLSRKIGDRQGEAYSLYVLSLFHQGEASARRLLEESLALYRILGDKPGQARVLQDLAFTYHYDANTYQDGAKRVRALLEEGLVLYREAGDPINVSRHMVVLATKLIHYEDYAAARKLIEEALLVQRQLGLKDAKPATLTLFGQLAFWQGDWQQARAYLEESIALYDEIGECRMSFWSHVHLAYVFLRQGELAPARHGFMDILDRSRNIGRIIGTVFVLEGLASLAVAENRPARAAALFAWADETRRMSGDPRPRNEQADVDRDLAAIRLQLDEATLQAAQAAGRAMTLEEAIAFALNDQDM
ncbi:MAG: LuxR C-terminal-related transcriptional regulator [Anaerolineales bacterium]